MRGVGVDGVQFAFGFLGGLDACAQHGVTGLLDHGIALVHFPGLLPGDFQVRRFTSAHDGAQGFGHVGCGVCVGVLGDIRAGGAPCHWCAVAFGVDGAGDDVALGGSVLVGGHVPKCCVAIVFAQGLDLWCGLGWQAVGSSP